MWCLVSEQFLLLIANTHTLDSGAVTGVSLLSAFGGKLSVMIARCLVIRRSV